MVSQKATVMNATGLHARAASAFVKEAVRHAGCNILIRKDGKTYMGKSIVSVLSACVKCGTEIELVADGTDEAQTLQDMVNRQARAFHHPHRL